MLLTTQAGVVVNSCRIAYIALQRENVSADETDDPPRTFRVLLAVGFAEGDGIFFIVAAHGLSEAQARFLREDIAHYWEGDARRWKATEALERHAEGTSYADDSAGDCATTDAEEAASVESEVTGGQVEFLPPLHDV